VGQANVGQANGGSPPAQRGGTGFQPVQNSINAHRLKACATSY
jgi:hypothetical protein